MIDTKIEVGGGATYWSLGEWTNRACLLEALEMEGLGKFCPEVRTPQACLRDALAAAFCDGSYTVKHVAKRDGFAVYETKPEEFCVRDVHVVTAKIDPACRITYHDDEGNGKYCEKSEEIVNQFNRHSAWVTAASVSASLVKILDSLGGVRLRPKGSIYWLPDHKLPQWSAVAKAVEASATAGPHAVYLLRHTMDADALRAVKDAIVSEVTTAAARIEAEIAKAELGDRALESRKEEAQRLRAKVADYEALLGVSLKELADVADKAEQAAATAVLMESAAGAA